jgi:hypothetical protein
MTNIALYISVLGTIMFATMLTYQLTISNKIKRHDFLRNQSDPVQIERYKLMTSKKYIALISMFLLANLLGIFFHISRHNSNPKIAIYASVILFVIIFMQTAFKFRNK